MRIFIAADMEGATGVVHPDQLMPEGRNYEAARKLLTGDVNAAIEGVLESEPDATFVVGDGHATMKNVVFEHLHERAALVIGPATEQNKPTCQLEGLDDSFDLMFQVGYHSKSGTPGGLLAHTYVGSVICHFRLNGKAVGEIAVNAAVAASFGVPTGLVTGNSELADEVREDLPEGVGFVATKRTLGPTAAICDSPVKTARAIQKAAREATQRARTGGCPLPEVPTETVMAVETYRREHAERAAARTPGLERTGEREFTARARRACDAYRNVWCGLVTAQLEYPGWLR